MARSEAVVLTNMCMLYDHEGNILVQDRLDPSWPGVTFPGGHVEPGESFTGAVIREIREDDGTRYIVILYKTDRFSGELMSSSEGKVFWIKRSELGKYHLPESFEMYSHWEGSVFKRELF